MAVRTPSQTRAKRTRAALIDAARAEFTERGYASTTARSIAERAGVATGTFYQYFPDKDAALDELARERAAAVSAWSVGVLGSASAGDARDRFRALAAAALRSARDDAGMVRVLRERRCVDAALEATWNAGERAIVERAAALLRRASFTGDADATALVLFGMVDGAVEAHLASPMVDDDRFLTALVDALLAVAGLRG